jgi:D-serine dehydratase
MYDDLECRLAAGFHPRFRKLFWLDTVEERAKLKSEMIKAVAELLREQGAALVEVEDSVAALQNRSSMTTSDPAGTVRVLDAVFANFNLPESTKAAGGLYEKNAEKLVNDWCSTEAAGTLDDFAFCSDKNFIQLFIRYNTTVSSSAAVERSFSAGRDILRPKRYSMTDATFNALMFMRGNRMWKKKWNMQMEGGIKGVSIKSYL